MRCSQTSLDFLLFFAVYAKELHQPEELPDSSFLDFIIEMDEVTGEGFEQ